MASEAKAAATDVVSQVEVIESPIAKLADKDLVAIFKDLPLFERLIVSAVCRKWRDLCKTPWRDVAHLNLSQIPAANIYAVIRKCPNLISVSALRQNLGDLGRFASRLRNITSLKCVECTFTVDHNIPRSVGVGALLRNASWNELIWQNSKVLTKFGAHVRARSVLYDSNPHALRRLLMSELSFPKEEFGGICGALQLPLLECLIMAGINWLRGHVTEEFLRSYGGEMAFSVLAAATNLRELYLDAPGMRAFVKLAFALPHLQIVFLNNINFEQQHLERLMMQHRSLRVLVFTASRINQLYGEITIPVRKLFPNGFNAQSVSPLHLFLGKIAAEILRFHPSPTNALKIHPIDAPLPEFLEKEEVRLIFEGSWIASRIKEGAKEGFNLANYSFEGNAASISYVQT